MSFRVGSKVRFKGDPESEVYTLSYDYTGISEGKYERVDLTVGGWRLEGVPTRLLEKVAPKLEPGQVWEHPDTGIPFFVVDVSDGVVTYTFPMCHSPVRSEPDVFNGYTRAYPPQEDL